MRLIANGTFAILGTRPPGSTLTTPSVDEIHARSLQSMMQCIAFPEPAVPRETPLGSVEPAVNWYLESTRREAIAGRAQISQLYTTFPDPSGHFLQRLRSANDADHLGALDELTVYDRMAQGTESSLKRVERGQIFVRTLKTTMLLAWRACPSL
jgi:hypothetical protein